MDGDGTRSKRRTKVRVSTVCRLLTALLRVLGEEGRSQDAKEGAVDV